MSDVNNSSRSSDQASSIPLAPPLALLPTIKTSKKNENNDNTQTPFKRELNGDGNLPKAFKFGQVDQNMLLSRLYSTPLKPIHSHRQQYSIDMSRTALNKPRLKKLEPTAPVAEPVVSILLIKKIIDSFLYLYC
jgi:hypothetical protein